MKQSIIQFFQNIFQYHEEKEYDFTVLEEDINEKKYASYEEEIIQQKPDNPKNVFPSLSVNLECMHTSYNKLINSDIMIREFTLNARNTQYSAFIIYIDGMVDSKLINQFVLDPLMLKNPANTYAGEENRIIKESVTNNITVRKVKRFNLLDYIYNCLIPQNSVKKITEFSEIINRN